MANYSLAHLIRSPTGAVLSHRSPAGAIHPLHPIFCADPRCQAWADELTIAPEDGVVLFPPPDGGTVDDARVAPPAAMLDPPSSRPASPGRVRR
jgi:hypothetical protein